MHILHFIRSSQTSKNLAEGQEVARFCKASQFGEWFVNYVYNGNWAMVKSPQKLSQEHLEWLLDVCNKTRRYGIQYIGTDEFDCDHYRVNKPIARTFLPIRQNLDGELFFPYAYDDHYAKQIIQGIQSLNTILSTTNFENDAIYLYCE